MATTTRCMAATTDQAGDRSCKWNLTEASGNGTATRSTFGSVGESNTETRSAGRSGNVTRQADQD